MLNKLIIQGYLIRSLGIKESSNGQKYVSFTVVWNSNANKSNARHCFVNCCAFGKTAEFIEKYFNPKDQMILEGFLQTTEYTDKEGSKRNSISLIVEKVNFCGNKNLELNEKHDEDDDEVLPF